MVRMSRLRIQSRDTQPKLCRTAYRMALCAAGVHLSAVAALAQRPGRTPDEDGGALQWVVVAGVAVVICLTGFMNSKRSHLN